MQALHQWLQSGLVSHRLAVLGMQRLGLLLLVMCGCLLSNGCWRKETRMPAWLENKDVTNLLSEARSLAYQQHGEWTWKGSDVRLPPTIRSLMPLRVILYTNPPPALIDIRMSGGFYHHGLIIICTTNGSYNERRYGNNWILKPVVDYIYEYKE